LYPQTICTGGLFKLTAEIDANKNNYSAKWLNTIGFIGNDTDWAPELVLNTVGTYQYILEITDKLTFCRIYDTVTVVVLPGVSLELGNDISACPGEKVTLKAMISGGGSGFNYKWKPLDKIIIPNSSDSSIAEITTFENELVVLEVNNDGGCSSIDTLMLNIPIPKAELSIPTLEFNSKQRDVIIPVYFNSETNLLSCKPRFVRLKLEWNFSVFNPRRAFAKGKEIHFQRDFKQNFRTWETTLDIPDSLINTPGENVVEILGDAMLGESDTAGLYIKSIQWDNFVVNNIFQSGFLKINDICEIGGKRLIDYSGAFIIKNISPIPTSENITVGLQYLQKQSFYNLKIINIFGEIISEINLFNPDEIENKMIYTGGFSPGIYKIVVTGVSASANADFLIIR
jgi:hypothetical protein